MYIKILYDIFRLIIKFLYVIYFRFIYYISMNYLIMNEFDKKSLINFIRSGLLIKTTKTSNKITFPLLPYPRI